MKVITKMYEELIKALRDCTNPDKCCEDCDFFNKCYKSTEHFLIEEQAADAIEDLEKCLAITLLEYQKANNKLLMTEEYVKQKNRWIPVTEQLPEHSGDYLVYSVGGNWKQLSTIEIAFWNDKNFIVQSFFAVTHWMPLPELPKEG